MSVLDMPTLEWQTEYKPAKAPYFVPQTILTDSTIDGKLINKPEKGWASPELAKLFEGKPASLPKAVLIGVAVGALALFVLLLTVGYVFYRRHKAQSKQVPTPITPPGTSPR
jgi:hypothetical protein